MKQQKHIHMPMYPICPCISFLQEQVQIYFRTWEPYSHCPDSEAKDHRGSSNPKGEGRDRK